MQGRSDPNRELMDAAALVGHLVRPGTVYELLAEHRHRLFPDEFSSICSRRVEVARRSPLT